MDNECVICLDNTENNIVCFNCNSNVCLDCMDTYVSTCGINQLPVCPSYCKEQYLIESMNKKYLDKYVEYLCNYLTKNPNFINKIERGKRIESIIKKIRKEKANRLNKFPAGIRTVIDICFRAKAEKVMRTNKQQILDILEENKIKCFSGVCNNGMLNDKDGDLECDSCYSIFCNKCEKPKFQNHECSKDDIESIKYINERLSCPNCKAPVEKISGCSSLTCSLCKTKFQETGVIGGHGGHEDEIKMRKDSSYKLYNELEGKYSEEIFEIIKDFESYIPPLVNEESLMIYFTDNHEIKPDTNKIELYNTYSNVMRSISQRKKHYQKIDEIRKMHIDDKLTLVELRKILSNKA